MPTKTKVKQIGQAPESLLDSLTKDARNRIRKNFSPSTLNKFKTNSLKPIKRTKSEQRKIDKVISEIRKESTFVTEIRKTLHYEWFEIIESNRNIYPAHVKNLIASYSHILLDTKAVLTYLHINKNGTWKLMMVDGQHTYAGRMMKGEEIPFIIDDNLNIKNAQRALKH